jgi:radical SAM protein with 4Fe4S-binding SPASM domain
MSQNLKGIEIEIHNYCNRRCSFCSNRFADRSEYMELDENAYMNVIKDLASIAFCGVVSFSRYNEPLAKPKLLKQRVNQARHWLQENKLVLNSNGDFLNAENLEGLNINELSVMDYDNRGSARCLRRLEEFGAEIIDCRSDCILAHFKKITIAYFTNWLECAELYDRGGALQDLSISQRAVPCLYPSRYAAIDFNGNVMPCCDLRSDIEDHKSFVLGNVENQSILDILSSEKAKVFQVRMAGQPPYPGPCEHCQRKLGRYIRDDPGILYDLQEPANIGSEN